MASPDVEKYLKGLHSENWKTRARAASSLGKLGEAAVDAVPALLQYLNDEHFQVRMRVSRALHKIFPDHAKALHYFSYKLGSENPITRAQAVLALGHFHEAGHRVMNDLYKLLQDPEEIVREAAVDSLAHLGPGEQILDGYEETVRRELSHGHSPEEILGTLTADGVQPAHAAALYYRVKRDLRMIENAEQVARRQNTAAALSRGSSKTLTMLGLVGLPVLLVAVVVGGILLFAAAEEVTLIPVVLFAALPIGIGAAWIKVYTNHLNRPTYGASPARVSDGGDGGEGALARLHRDSLDPESSEQENLFDSGWASHSSIGSASEAPSVAPATDADKSPRILGMLKHHKINAKFAGVDLFRALQGLGQSLDLSIVLYANLVKQAESLPVSFHAQDTPLGAVLEGLLQNTGWTYEVKGQKIVVCTPQQAIALGRTEAPLIKKAAPPRPAPRAAPTAPFEFDMAELEQSDTSDLYEEGVDTALDALTEPAAENLDVSEVLELDESDLQFEEVGGATGFATEPATPSPAAAPAPAPTPAPEPAISAEQLRKEAEILQILETRKINAKFAEVDLFRALQGLGQSLGLAIVLYGNLVDPAKQTRVALDAQDTPLGQVLDTLLRPQGWTHFVKGEKIIVATEAQAAAAQG